MVYQKEWVNDQSKLPRSIYLLMVCVTIIGSNSLVLGPIAPSVSLSLNTTTPTTMMATSAFGLGAAISALLLSHNIDRFGPKRILKFSMQMLPTALLISAVSPAVSILIIAQLLAGISSGIALPAIYTLAVSIAPKGLESKAIGIVLTGWTLSLVAGVSLSAIITDLIHWRAVYGITSLLAVFAFLSLRLIKSDNVQTSNSVSIPLSALNLQGIKPLLLACGTFMAAFYGIYSYIGDYLNNKLGLPISTNGLIALVYGVGFGSAVLFNNLVNKINPSKALSISLLLVSFSYFLLSILNGNLSSILIIFGLLGLINHYGINLLIVQLTAIEPSSRGAIMGLYSTVTNLAMFIGIGCFGGFYTAWGFSTICFIAMILGIISTVSSSCRSVRF